MDAIPTSAVLTRAQLDLLAEHLDAGADPHGLALWISRITATGALSVETIRAAAEDLKLGYDDGWYAAADAAERSPS